MGSILSFRATPRKGPAAQVIHPGENQFTGERIRREFFYLAMPIRAIANREHLPPSRVECIVREMAWPRRAA